jgi:hypothetical protein
LLFLVESFIHYPMLLASGDLPTDRDSIGIPMAEARQATPFLLLFLAVWALPAVIGARASPRLFAWRRERAVRSAIGTLVYGGAALLIGVSILWTPFVAQGALRLHLPDGDCAAGDLEPVPAGRMRRPSASARCRRHLPLIAFWPGAGSGPNTLMPP